MILELSQRQLKVENVLLCFEYCLNRSTKLDTEDWMNGERASERVLLNLAHHRHRV